jgi:DNA-binding CsgD family transcriptional regulator
MSEMDEEDSRSFVVDENELVDQDELIDEDEHEDQRKRRIITGLVRIIQRRYALTNVTYMSPCFGGSDRVVQVLGTTYSNEWVSHYKAQEYGDVDPVIIAGARSALPVDMATLAWKSKKARRLFDEAQAAGIGEQGLVIPLRGPVNGIWGLLSVTSDATAREWEKRHEELSRELLFVGHQVHHFVFMLYGEPSPEISLGILGVRETNALQQFADGATLNEIASAMRVKLGTVKAYLASARVKLHADNGFHAITVALRAGLIH